MKSTVYTILAVLTLHVGMVQSQRTNERRDVNLKCLNRTPSDQCDLAVIYERPVGTLQCDEKVHEDDGDPLVFAPELRVSPNTQEISQGVIVMFDPDAPVSDQATDGFVHWMVPATVDKTGLLTIGEDYIEYTPPMPPADGVAHRYQFFLYKMDVGKPLIYTNSRKFNLCSFMKQNNLAQPVAMFQFRFQRH